MFALEEFKLADRHRAKDGKQRKDASFLVTGY
jgi:hypothetical protein